MKISEDNNRKIAFKNCRFEEDEDRIVAIETKKDVDSAPRDFVEFIREYILENGNYDITFSKKEVIEEEEL